MKKVIVIGVLAMCGCTMTVKPDVATQAAIAQVQDVVNQHAAVINAITGYIADLQAKGKLPKPTPTPEAKK